MSNNLQHQPTGAMGSNNDNNSSNNNSNNNNTTSTSVSGIQPPTLPSHVPTANRPASAATAPATATLTITEAPPNQQPSDEVLRLTLRPRPNVTWNEDVIDNEGLGRKSSKRCCIFHKERPFGESSTDSENDSDGSSSSGGPGGGGNSRPIARKKKGTHHKNYNKKQPIPDYQRFHA